MKRYLLLALGVAAVLGQVHPILLLAQAADQEPADRRVVLYHQQAHGPHCRTPGLRAAPGLLVARQGTALDEGIERRHHHEGEQRRGDDAADHHARERSLDLGARSV